MKDENEIDEELSYQEIAFNHLEALMSAIPYVGSAINTLYFGHKRDRQFKRLQELYRLLKEDLNKLEHRSIRNINHLDNDALVGIIELIHESAEKDYTATKLKYLRNCYYHSLIDQRRDNYEDRKVFIKILDELSEYEIEILSELYLAPDENHGYTLDQFEGDEKDTVYAIFERLKSYGLAHLKLHRPVLPNVDFTEHSMCAISKYGRKFYDYCLTLSDH